MTLNDLPVWFTPISPVIIFGFLLTPPLCLWLLILTAIRFKAVTPRPYTLTVFFGCIASTVAIEFSPLWGKYCVLFLYAMSLAAFLVVGEVSIRRLSGHYASAASAVAICIGYYFFLLSLLIIAGV